MCAPANPHTRLNLADGVVSVSKMRPNVSIGETKYTKKVLLGMKSISADVTIAPAKRDDLQEIALLEKCDLPQNTQSD